MADDISRVRRSRKALGIRWLYGQRMGAGRVGTRNQVYHRSRNRVDLATLLGRGRKNQFLAEALPPKLVFPPTAQQPGQVHSVPGAAPYLISCSHTPGTHALPI